MFERLFHAVSRPPLSSRRARLSIEALEDRTLPAQYMWIAAGAGNWNTAANWQNLVSPFDNTVPGANDYALFGNGGAGANTNCTVNTSPTVNRILMDANYTATLSVPSGNTLTTSNYFIQYGALSIAGTVNAGTYIDINGAVTHATAPFTTASMTAAGSFYVNAGATITASTGMGASSLAITSSGFDHGGTINCGSGGGAGLLTISGTFLQLSAAITNIYPSSVLTFLANGGGNPHIEGTMNLGVSSGGATVSTDSSLDIDAGTLNSVGGTDNIVVGDLAVYNSGAIEVGYAAGNDLVLTTGSLTVGTSEPGLAPTGGSVNVYAASALSFPAAEDVTSRFYVTNLGVVSLYGAIITMDTDRVAEMELVNDDPWFVLTPGRLTSYGYTGGPPTFLDIVDGNVSNGGIIDFDGAALHALFITGDYTQTEDGALAMRLDDSPGNDVLDVSGDVTLDGVLDLSKVEDLSDDQEWDLILTGGDFAGNFETINYPDADADWHDIPGEVYTVSNEEE